MVMLLPSWDPKDNTQNLVSSGQERHAPQRRGWDSQRKERIEMENARAVCNRPRKERFDCVLTIQSRLAGWLLDTPSKIFDYLQIASTITRRYCQDHHNAKRNAR
jgi:hypothetical protein